MASKIFLDANILLDFTLQREEYKVAKKLIEQILEGNLRGYTTSSIVHIVGYWLTKSYGAAKAKELLLNLLSDIIVIDISHDEVLLALHSKINDIEDALQYYTALSHKIDVFISNDKPLKKEAMPVLPIYTAKEFVRLLEV